MTTLADRIVDQAEEAVDDDNWAEGLWERPAPDPERLARWRQHDPNEPSRYVRHTAHLPALDAETVESDAFWMRLLRRASVGH